MKGIGNIKSVFKNRKIKIDSLRGTTKARAGAIKTDQTKINQWHNSNSTFFEKRVINNQR